VILVLSRKADASMHDAGAVRRYLEAIGVPLFVWSPVGPRPEAEAAWGKIDDISSQTAFTAAVNRVRQTLDEQRIAWVDVDPLTALHLTANEACGIATLARPSATLSPADAGEGH
jgi:hypothetical protein